MIQGKLVVDEVKMVLDPNCKVARRQPQAVSYPPVVD